LTNVGDGPARQDLSNLASKLGISDRVVFTGWRDRDRLADIYRDHEMFVTASAMETQGLVVLEAMLCGLPVVATDKYALPDLVHHGQNGYLVQVGDCSGMADAVNTLLSHEQLRSDFGRVGRAMAEGHNITTVAPQFGEVYSRVVNNHEQDQGRYRGRQDVRAGDGGASWRGTGGAGSTR
jgi:glycosyltransferase involved in cell wall biosynthesis